jgi:hypothetical protein
MSAIGPVHRKVHAAIEAGELVRQPCEECGNEPAQAHHDDYDQPLAVRWLCDTHHKMWHAKYGQGLNRPLDDAVLVKSYILPEVYDRLEKLAFESHRSVAAELRVAIDEHLRNTGAK